MVVWYLPRINFRYKCVTLITQDSDGDCVSGLPKIETVAYDLLTSTNAWRDFFLKKWGHPRPLFRLFLVFFKQTSIQFYSKFCEKCPSSIWHWNSNPQPSELEYPPITTRPGLPPKRGNYFYLMLTVATYTVMGIRKRADLNYSLDLYVNNSIVYQLKRLLTLSGPWRWSSGQHARLLC